MPSKEVWGNIYHWYDYAVCMPYNSQYIQSTSFCATDRWSKILPLRNLSTTMNVILTLINTCTTIMHTESVDTHKLARGLTTLQVYFRILIKDGLCGLKTICAAIWSYVVIKRYIIMENIDNCIEILGSFEGSQFRFSISVRRLKMMCHAIWPFLVIKRYRYYWEFLFRQSFS